MQSEIFNISNSIDDVILGIERALTTVSIVFENYYDDLKVFKDPAITSRMEDYEAALKLSTDRIFEEKNKLIGLNKELFVFGGGRCE